MNTFKTAGLGLAAAALLFGGTAWADTVSLKLISSDAMPKLGGYMPQLLKLSETKPAGLKKTPTGLTAPLYGVLTLGGKETPTSVILIVDEPKDKDARLFVDSNGNGDLTDDPKLEWKGSPYPDKSGMKIYQGGATVQLKTKAKPLPLHLGMYRFDKNDTRRPQLKTTLLYFSDYAYEGEIKLGDKTYKVMLTDDMATGDFRGKVGERGSGVRLLIDVNGNGKFERRGETYDISKPFNIKGTTYEIANMSPSGDKFDIIKSAKTVAEILPPPDLSVGKPALVFTAKTTDGKTVKFPSDFKGKLVMLDFWATWCGPCRAELPGLVKAYETYHDKGFEVLGISLDQENASSKLADFTKENKMGWAQVYDGKYWEAEIAQLYVVDSIPRAFLVDGDTGEIVAGGGDLRGDELDKTLKAALDKKKKAAAPAP